MHLHNFTTIYTYQLTKETPWLEAHVMKVIIKALDNLPIIKIDAIPMSSKFSTKRNVNHDEVDIQDSSAESTVQISITST